MKNIIKILLILIVVIGIASAVYFTIGGIGDGGDGVIASSPFEKTIQNRVNSEIKGKNYSDATRAYQSILDEVKTEASVTDASGKSMLTSDEVQNCQKMAYYEYVPIFTKFANEMFRRSVWPEGDMKTLKDNAQSLLSAKIADSNSSDMGELRKVTKTVDEYFAALSVVSRSKKCSSASDVNNVIGLANSYKRAPLTNCSSLVSGLNSVPSNAKNSYAGSVASYCNGIASRYRNYGDYVGWSHAYEGAISRINEYTRQFGSNSAISSARGRLNSADDEALSYYSSSY